ncbi:hypothetical protein [Chromobacterium haemolyticum]|uniref:hypothetical protein n=1 Tax=Chromobacterium haemolyticum TaxID=394935 RepID=UPI0009DAFE4E|nr:hypothetical protein [Chromobacterium haemolyticum]OQS41166.1 hypothetical protein B0T39_09410 [Chromobacterium haemolyticum]
MTDLEKQLLDVARSILADDMLPLLPAEYVAKVRSAIAAAEEASPNYPAVPEGWALVKSPITEDMHRAAVKVLVRANGVDGLPQRMLDAMVATAPPATVKDSLIVQQATGVPDDARECLLDVVSHHQVFVDACRFTQMHVDGENVLYWKHQIDVLDRMKEQAERALRAAPTQEAGARLVAEAKGGE